MWPHRGDGASVVGSGVQVLATGVIRSPRAQCPAARLSAPHDEPRPRPHRRVPLPRRRSIQRGQRRPCPVRHAARHGQCRSRVLLTRPAVAAEDNHAVPAPRCRGEVPRRRSADDGKGVPKVAQGVKGGPVSKQSVLVEAAEDKQSRASPHARMTLAGRWGSNGCHGRPRPVGGVVDAAVAEHFGGPAAPDEQTFAGPCHGVEPTTGRGIDAGDAGPVVVARFVGATGSRRGPVHQPTPNQHLGARPHGSVAVAGAGGAHGRAGGPTGGVKPCKLDEALAQEAQVAGDRRGNHQPTRQGRRDQGRLGREGGGELCELGVQVVDL